MATAYKTRSASVAIFLDFVTVIVWHSAFSSVHGLQRHAITSGILPELKYALKYEPVFIQTLKPKQKLKLKLSE